MKETAQAIFDLLSLSFLATPSEEDLKVTAAQMFTRWKMANCIGARDGKHISLQCPFNSGSQFYNYKNYFSIILLSTCDANYNFCFMTLVPTDLRVIVVSLLGLNLGSASIEEYQASSTHKLPGTNTMIQICYYGSKPLYSRTTQ